MHLLLCVYVIDFLYYQFDIPSFFIFYFVCAGEVEAQRERERAKAMKILHIYSIIFKEINYIIAAHRIGIAIFIFRSVR